MNGSVSVIIVLTAIVAALIGVLVYAIKLDCRTAHASLAHALASPSVVSSILPRKYFTLIRSKRAASCFSWSL